MVMRDNDHSKLEGSKLERNKAFFNFGPARAISGYRDRRWVPRHSQ